VNGYDILFAHLPYIFPLKLAENISSFSYNNPDKFIKLFGGIKFSGEEDKIQLLLQQQEFLVARLLDFILAKVTKNYNLNKLLLLGHALVHSQNVISEFTKVDHDNSTGIKIIESIRKDISLNNNPNISMSIEDILQSLMIDTFDLLILTSKVIDSYLHFWTGDDLTRFLYSRQVVLDQFVRHPKDLKFETHENQVVIKGLPYTVPIVKHMMYSEPGSNIAVCEPEFLRGIELRKRRIVDSATFNFINFGQAYGRGRISPYANGSIYDNLAINLIRYFGLSPV
jgi:hypothetical protein